MSTVVSPTQHTKRLKDSTLIQSGVVKTVISETNGRDGLQ